MPARTLYVSRPLLNGAEVVAWAKGQGFAKTLPPEELHVTIAYSREAFDWSGIQPDAGTLEVPAGRREVKALGKDGEAAVLGFESAGLHSRWSALRDAGASWDWPEYQPHVSISYDAAGRDLGGMSPFAGPLVFGPEKFAEVDDDWSSGVQEKARPARMLRFGPMSDIFVAPFEVKSAGVAGSGEFEGYGAVFGNVDSHGDIILPGAFKEGLAERKAAGRRIAMHLNHGLPQLGGRRGVGSYHVVEEDSRGLYVKGRIAGMGTETGRYLHAGLVDGAYTGLSIGWSPRVNGIEHVKGADGARRHLKAVNVIEISIVDDPSNADALITQVKAVAGLIDKDRARASIAALAALHQSTLTGGAAPTAGQRAEMLSHLRDLHEIAVGEPMPDTGTKAVPSTLREFEAALREIGFSHSQARDIAAAGFTQTPHRDDAGGQASAPEAKSAAYIELMATLGAPVTR